MATTVGEERERTRDSGGPAGERAEGPGPPRGLLREYFESAAVVLVMAVFFMTFVAQAAEVPSASMENTVYVGDRFLINKFIFAPGPALPFLPQREVRRGDIVVFKYPAESVPAEKVVQYKTLFIKRVVGLPGETVEVRDTKVFINGRPLEEHVVTALNPPEDDPRTPENEAGAPLAVKSEPAPTGEWDYKVYTDPERRRLMRRLDGTYGGDGRFVVPEGNYFMMGDNRDNSRDSRYWGPVPRELVVGRAMFVIWSYDESAPQETGGIGFVRNFFNNTRWGRIGTMLR